MEIVQTLRRAGHVAFFAGGCVRDELLGLEPTDYDVATDATPDRIRALFPRTDEVGASFGVILVKIRRITVEVATFRSEGPYSDRRRPDAVHFSDPVTDARRRDFTINALFLDPLAAPDPSAPIAARGRVIDYVGGIPDITGRILRAVGDPGARLAEDHLRALRAARFAARLSLRIDPATEAAVRAHAAQLRGVSRERIGEEVRRMLTHPTRAASVRLLRRLGLEQQILGETAQPGDVKALAALPPGAPYPLALAAWARDRGEGPEAASRWRDALCLSNDDRAAMQEILQACLVVEQSWQTLGVAARKRAAARPWFAGAVDLVRVVDPGLASAVEADVADLARTGLAPSPVVTGEDLIAMGLSPGPMFKRILDRVYDAQLEGRVAGPEAGRRLALEMARGGEPGGGPGV